jgi:hypothetical protein
MQFRLIRNIHTRATLGISRVIAASRVTLVPRANKQVKGLVSQPSGWEFAKACLPDYGVLLTFHSNAEIKIALCFECDMLAVFVGNK